MALDKDVAKAVETYTAAQKRLKDAAYACTEARNAEARATMTYDRVLGEYRAARDAVKDALGL